MKMIKIAKKTYESNLIFDIIIRILYSISPHHIVILSEQCYYYH